MNQNIINGAPMSRNLGIKDDSRRTLAPVAEARPTHMPKVFGYAQKGDHTKAYPVIADSRDAIFGADSFDLRKKWANHATLYSNAFSAQGNMQMFQRVKPADAPDPATLRLWLDLLPTKVQDYERNADGTYKRNGTNQLIPVATKVPGFVGKWVVEAVDTLNGESTFGIAGNKAGDQTDTESSTQSTRYPILDLKVSSFGSWGNNQAIRIWAPTTKSSNPVDQRLVEDQKVYPFFIACAERADELSTSRIVPTLSGSQQVPFSFKRGVIDRNTDKQLYLGDVFLDAYQDVGTPGMSPQFGQFGDIRLYDENIATVTGLVYAAEFAAANIHSDFDGSTDEQYRVNLISGVSSTGAPYSAYQVVTGQPNSARLTENSSLYALGGGDGTMNNTAFAELVSVEFANYADENHPVQDSATNPESIFYDSGFPVETKKAMAQLLAIRKDIAVVAVTHEDGGRVLSDEEERSLATALLTHFQAYAESAYFGTAAARACIVGSSGYIMNSQWVKRAPASFEIAMKAAEYMGAANGKWKAGLAFDTAPRSQIDHMRDLALPFRPATARNKDWEAGLIWPQSYSRSRFFFPQLQTIYPDDTSVLNNFFTMLACVELQKIGEDVHRDFSGVSGGLTEEQLKERINAKILADVKDKFDNRYVITPDTTFTADDKLRGYSWTTTITIQSPMMKTVQTLIIETKRQEGN
jgi:hypothetical protein